ncbi:MAG: AAA family ATPase [Dehalococcoidia bacterium]|nr:AAA family ATPase [Dehalococcoidia bacterium]
MTNRFELAPELLRWRCGTDKFHFECTSELAPLQEFIGQDRAIKAIELGLAVDKPGYNIFVTGLTGTGKTSLIKSYLQKIVTTRLAEGADFYPRDWCYLFDFSDSDKPQAVDLPQGTGKVFKGQIDDMLKLLRTEITKAFSSDDYNEHRKEIMETGEKVQRDVFQALEKEAKGEGFLLRMSPMGMMVVPMADGKPYSQEEYLALEDDTKAEIEGRRTAFMARAGETLEKAQEQEKDTSEKMRALDEKAAESAIARPFQELMNGYKEVPKVVTYLENAKAYTMKNLDLFRRQEEAAPTAPVGDTQALGAAMRSVELHAAFQVNVFVDNSGTQGPPIVMETNPTYGNMFGRIERRFFMGAYLTDHTMLKPGGVSLANGGYLVVNARDLLMNPGVWEGLKRVIKNRELRIEDPLEQFGYLIAHGLKPQPIPTDVKCIVIGDAQIYQMLSAYDEDFWEIFKIKADFDYEIDLNQVNIDAYCAFISSYCEAEKLHDFDKTGVAKIIEHGARLVADQEKLSSRFGIIKDLLIEADYWARKEGSVTINGGHVTKAIEEKYYRSNMVEQHLQEMINRGTIMVDTEGAVPGQLNGLAVYDLGDISFGKPSRITAQTFMGRGGVINIEREAKMSGRTHDKGVLILSGYLGYKYAQEKPLSLSASICFEQAYEGVDGDSASSTELYAILSSIAEVPLRQDLAVTGSVNQKGQVQPIGGVNQKIEGFFEVCKAKGFTGNQGVMIPDLNIKNMMLRDEVVDAVKDGRFHIYAVKSIDEGIELLSGLPAGERGEDGTFPEGTINHLVNKRLRQMAENMRSFQSNPDEKKAESKENNHKDKEPAE